METPEKPMPLDKRVEIMKLVVDLANEALEYNGLPRLSEIQSQILVNVLAGRTTSKNITVELPHNVEAEEALLSSVLLDPESLLRIKPFMNSKDFYIAKNRWVWDAFVAIHDAGAPIDFVTVCNVLEQRGQLAEVGGPAFISHLVNVVPTAIHAEGYGRIVERASQKRTQILASVSV